MNSSSRLSESNCSDPGCALELPGEFLKRGAGVLAAEGMVSLVLEAVAFFKAPQVT